MTAGLAALLIIFCVLIGLAYIVAIPICVASIAQKQGRSGIGWFFLSIVINPLFAILILIALGDTEAKRIERAMNDERARDSVRNKVYNNQKEGNYSQQKTNDYSQYMPH